MRAESLATRAAAPKILRVPGPVGIIPGLRTGAMDAAGDGIDDRVKEPPPGYRMQSEDTSYAIEQMLFARWREMEPHEKAALIGALHEAIRDLVRCGVEERHPEAGEEEVEMRVLVKLVGADLVERARGWRERPLEGR
jgi:hypothetical protein